MLDLRRVAEGAVSDARNVVPLEAERLESRARQAGELVQLVLAQIQ